MRSNIATSNTDCADGAQQFRRSGLVAKLSDVSGRQTRRQFESPFTQFTNGEIDGIGIAVSDTKSLRSTLTDR